MYPKIVKTKHTWRYIFYYQKAEKVGDLFYTDIVTDKGFNMQKVLHGAEQLLTAVTL